MTKFTFFVRNVIMNRGINADYIHVCVDGGLPKQTSYIAYPENCPAQRARVMKAVADTDRFVDNEYSKPYFAALKAFMAMGFNDRFDYVVDAELNVSVVEREGVAA